MAGNGKISGAKAPEFGYELRGAEAPLFHECHFRVPQFLGTAAIQRRVIPVRARYIMPIRAPATRQD
jgi:hypothetical protein